MRISAEKVLYGSFLLVRALMVDTSRLLMVDVGLVFFFLGCCVTSLQIIMFRCDLVFPLSCCADSWNVFTCVTDGYFNDIVVRVSPSWS